MGNPPGGTSLTVPVANLLGSSTLVAVMVTVWLLAILEGAVYKPLADKVPTDGFIDQVTAVLVAPVTVATNC